MNATLYCKNQRESGFKVGDEVIITRAAGNHEKGWSTAWVDKMNLYIGQKGIIVCDAESHGFSISFNNKPSKYVFPYFVLEHADSKIKELFLSINVFVELSEIA
jgi:hypothetical protein